MDTVCQRAGGGERGSGTPGTPRGGEGAVGAQMTCVGNVMVIVEEVCSEAVDVRYTDTMVVTIEEVEKAVVQGGVLVVGRGVLSVLRMGAKCESRGRPLMIQVERDADVGVGSVGLCCDGGPG
eukprot:3272854-Rhodomonas_salina.1